MPSKKGRPSSAVRNSRTSPMDGEENDDGDLVGLAVPSIPNVYFSYSSANGGPIEQAQENERQQPGRPKSRSRTASAKRPISARKGLCSEQMVIKSEFLSFDEAQQMVLLVLLLPLLRPPPRLPPLCATSRCESDNEGILV